MFRDQRFRVQRFKGLSASDRREASTEPM